MPAEKADTDPLSHTPLLDAAPERVDLSDRLMARHARIGESRKTAFDRDHIAVADTAGFDANANMPRRRLCHRQVHRLELAGRDRLNRSVRCTHVRFTSL